MALLNDFIGGISGLFSWIATVLFLLLLVWFIISLVNPANSKSNIDNIVRENALNNLKDRYAKGEINKEQFKKTKRELMK